MSIDRIPILFIDPKAKNYLEEDEEINFGKKIAMVFKYLSKLFDSPLDATFILGNKVYYYNNTTKSLKETYSEIPNVFGHISENTDIYIEKLKDYAKNKLDNNKQLFILTNIFLSDDINEVYSANKIKQLYNTLSESKSNFCFYNESYYTPGDSEFINKLQQDKHVTLLPKIKWEDVTNCATSIYNGLTTLLQAKEEINY